MGSSCKQSNSLSDQCSGRVWDSGGCQEEVGSVPCVDRLMERRGAQHSEYERTHSATQRETADMQQHRAAYMFKEAAAEWAVDEVY
ncbi:proline-rich transmembrane protein 4 isoform X2 [Lates japonicus]|uniref:Proline-rich transmembrane protein 4 isoform X2 n=1 Tax=Lates japonicus TaxID=270547 RepID=A0AAD3MS00_LATJO|nr:proline-rich transmembrane protein 4 isoform X2 [Lates japonicus]